MRARGELSPEARAQWLHEYAKRILPVFGLDVAVNGPVPRSGLLVCNHLSYLDIIALASCAPMMFVAKREVKGWPVFGRFARMGGTLFVDRERRSQVGERSDEIEAALRGGALVVLFAEGTSSDGSSVLPFKSSLLESAAGGRHATVPGCLQYELDDGVAGEDVCYWRDMTLVPHLLNLLSRKGPRCFVQFGPAQMAGGNRKEMARRLHAEVARMNARKASSYKSSVSSSAETMSICGERISRLG